MKIALGLFHFNPHWNLDGRSAHRHCTEALAPFLNAVRGNREWHVSLEMSGSGLEFVSESYPGIMRLLRELVHAGRVELISALYTPNIWVAFPRHDLLKSIQFNQKCLAKLELPWTRVFFAQEGFFGEAVSTLREFFDIGVCRDDYLAHHYGVPFSNPCFMRNGLKIVAASSHLLNEFTREMTADPMFAEKNALSPVHRRHIEVSRTLNDPSNFPGASGRFQDTEWHWYHCGDGNHFGSIYKPDDLERCYHDPVWSALCIRQMCSYMERGYKLGTIREFTEALGYRQTMELPPLVEGSWNPKQSGGLLLWLGRNGSPAENDAGVLTAITRSRARLIAASRTLQAGGPQSADTLEQAWSSLLHAQISDALGWCAGPQAVQHAMQNADFAFVTANRLLNDAGSYAPASEEPLLVDCVPVDRDRWPEAELFGGEGHLGQSSSSACVRLYECRFEASEVRCGVRFPFTTPKLEFCPSGMEHITVCIPMARFTTNLLTLPLANGLLRISDNTWLVKDTQTVHVCAVIHRDEGTVEFAVEGARPQHRLTWRFYVVAGPVEFAIAFANALNWADYHPITQSSLADRLPAV